MQIEAISFEIHNANLNYREDFLVEATEDNYDMILQHRFTRQIKFVKVFDFQFEKEEHTPVSFIDVPDAIDPIDEMVGAF